MNSGDPGTANILSSRWQHRSKPVVTAALRGFWKMLIHMVLGNNMKLPVDLFFSVFVFPAATYSLSSSSRVELQLAAMSVKAADAQHLSAPTRMKYTLFALLSCLELQIGFKQKETVEG